MPVWSDGLDLLIDVPSGNSAVSIDVTTRDFHVGGIGLLLSQNGETYEAFEIESIAGDLVTFVNPLTFSWLSGSRIYPARTARIEDLPLKRLTGGMVSGSVSFRCEELIFRTAATEPTYRGYPLMTQEFNWRDSPDYSYLRKLAEIDTLTGVPVIDDESDLSIPLQSFRWSCFNRTEVETLRQWLYARKGKQKAIWVPTWTDDLRLAVTLLASASNIDVEYAGLKQFLIAGIHRRDIRIELTSGAVYYRRVSGFVIVDSETERMTLDTPIGIEIGLEDVVRISWLNLLRSDADSVEISWTSVNTAEATITLRGPRNDV
jgi:hypothetical protein